ncbi:hypothetical protein CONCODRAFT_80523 [Conidiobolus coronatus NRRL 28638]|uniref:Glutaredoxin-like protein n=1 Tax=Conidiobolus coronatus (strain ATCC 28846 / CBS 209.66 / NRRL 28638) TaxID=796925 RepID=A0A137NUC5_CONC2|nr:hypothetical protein CONCODRAFT_80523 [Conidiobolus coronatus NRRL 28638]|eukprot:KXN66322.1 hypothetical protein CONCODRAFT_80523 [Conidiobolus coronatus NRRL 28638]
MSSKLTLSLFTSKTCSLCIPAYKAILNVQNTIPFTLNKVDISEPANKVHFAKYRYDIPVLTHSVGDVHKILQMHRIDEAKLINQLKEIESKNE